MREPRALSQYWGTARLGTAQSVAYTGTAGTITNPISAGVRKARISLGPFLRFPLLQHRLLNVKRPQLSQSRGRQLYFREELAAQTGGSLSLPPVCEALRT